MSMDWNEKLAAYLHTFPDCALGKLHDVATPYEMLVGTAAPDPSSELGARVAQASSWLATGADRAPMPAPGAEKSPRVDWTAKPELTHPLGGKRLVLETLDSKAARTALEQALQIAAKRFAGDPRRQYLWLWRYLPEHLAQQPGLGQAWLRLPADPRIPDHSAWQQMSLRAALTSAAPEPALLTVNLGAHPETLRAAANAHELQLAASRLASLSQVALRTLVERLGPDAVLQPSIWGQAWLDEWLASQGVTCSEKPAPIEKAPAAVRVPPALVAIVPSALAEEVGAAVSQAVLAEAQKIGCQATPQWTGVVLEEDSSGAGALLPARDITAFEKGVKQRRDASGMELEGKGAFFGLWYQVALAAADARANSMRFEEQAVAPSQGAQAELSTVALPEGPGALVLVSLDNAAEMLRNSADPKPICSLRSVLHTEMPAQLQRLRSRWRDALDAAVLSGPVRVASLQRAIQTWTESVGPRVVKAAGGVVLVACESNLLMWLPQGKLFGALQQLREACACSWNEPTGEPGLGPLATLSVAVDFAAAGDALGVQLARCKQMLEMGRRAVAREALVMRLGTSQERAYQLAGAWSQLGEPLQQLASLFATMTHPSRLLSGLGELREALVDAELDKPKAEVRVALVRSALLAAGAQCQADELENAARAVLALVERNAMATDADRRVLDGLFLARHVAEGVR